MGITVSWQFQTEGFNPLNNPMEASQRINQAVALATAELERHGIPHHLPDRVVTDRAYFQHIIPYGPGEGAEYLTIGWKVWYGDWIGGNFAKTEYAADFHRTHVAYCQALLKLQEQRLVALIVDVGRYLPNQDDEQLSISKGKSAAMLAAMDISYTATTPGGGVYVHQGSATLSDVPDIDEKVAAQFQKAMSNIAAMSEAG